MPWCEVCTTSIAHLLKRVSFDILNKSIDTHIECQWGQTVALQNTPAYLNEWCTKFRCDDGCVKFLVEAINDVRDRFRNFMIIVDLLNKIMINFPKSVFEVDSCNYKRSLLSTSCVYQVGHVCCMFISS